VKDCVFCRIVHGESPSIKIVENDTTLGILDTNPTVEGHCLIIPKRHIRYWHDLSDEETGTLFNTAKIVARRMKEVLGPDYVCVFIRGGRVKHLHVVLFPSNEGDELSGFPQSILGTAQVDLVKLQEKLKVKQ